MLDADGAERLADRVLRERFSEADAGFAAGSLIRGEGTVLSDLDFVVLYDRLPNARREAFTFDGVRIDVFIHDSETLRWVLNADVEAGKPAHLTMIAEGRIVGPRVDRARDCQARAQAMLAQGPGPFDPATQHRYRLLISDRIDDLRGQRSRAAMVATATWLYPALSDFIFRTRGAWAATAKWIPRELKRLDPVREVAFSEAFEALFANANAEPLIAFTEKVLEPFGGLLFEGAESQSPASARLKEP